MSLWEGLWEGLVDAVGDTVVLVPFLFATYLVMETLEHAGMERSQRLVSRAGRAGPLVGALLGAVPQCGFSAMAATLYAVRVVTLGTLVAVMLSTSDEMLPVFVANGAPVSMILSIVGFKIVVGIVAGFIVDLAVRVWRGPALPPSIHELCEREGCHCEEIDGELAMVPGEGCDCRDCALVDGGEDGRPVGDAPSAIECRDHGSGRGHDHEGPQDRRGDYGQELGTPSGQGLGNVRGHGHEDGRDSERGRVRRGDDRDHGHGHSHSHGESRGSVARGIALAALYHTAQVTLFILVITFVLDLVLEGIGDEAIASYLIAHPSQAVVASGIVGLIPNCAASVIISQLFLDGALGSGALISGLLVSAGVSLIVLFRTDRRWGRDFLVCAILLVVGIVCGVAVNLSGFTFA